MKRRGRIIGMTFDGRAIFEPKGAGSSLTLAAAGGGKTTCVTLPTILSLLDDPTISIGINDIKEGEVASQVAPVCAKLGRKLAIVDEFGARPELHQYRVSLNPFGDLGEMLKSSVLDVPFAIENISHALIDEPKDDARNFYWRESPRTDFIELAVNILLAHNPRLAFPGALHGLLSDPDSWEKALKVEIEEGKDHVKAAAKQTIALRDHNPEHYSQHLGVALSAIKIFATAPLRDAGRYPTITHKQLIEDGWVVCFINPVRYADRLGPFYALHFQALLKAKLAGAKGRLELVVDEFCNAPMRDALNAVTIQRAYGVRTHFIAQSRQDMVRRYGEKETAILEENCTIKQWLKFSNFEEAERVSQAIGDGTSVSDSLNVTSDRDALSAGFSTGKERRFTAEELMKLPPDEQIVHVADVGFIHCRKIRQNQIAPYCYDLGDNPLEGRRMEPDPKVDLSKRGGS